MSSQNLPSLPSNSPLYDKLPFLREPSRENIKLLLRQRYDLQETVIERKMWARVFLLTALATGCFVISETIAWWPLLVAVPLAVFYRFRLWSVKGHCQMLIMTAVVMADKLGVPKKELEDIVDGFRHEKTSAAEQLD